MGILAEAFLRITAEAPNGLAASERATALLAFSNGLLDVVGLSGDKALDRMAAVVRPFAPRHLVPRCLVALRPEPVPCVRLVSSSVRGWRTS